jgi:catechol 2,3-dioxygenase-like lactoylglutathione lyase family enzyme
MIGKWHGLIIDCPDPSSLASFYEELLGMVRVQDDGDWVVIGDAPDRPGVAFQQVEGFHPPTWPTQEAPQQMHFDVRVADLDAGEAAALKIGARRLDGGGETYRVFADPVGHPFCLVTM